MAGISRSIAAGALALATAGAVVAPAHAHGSTGTHHGGSFGLALTDGAARTLDRYDVKLRFASSTGRVVTNARVIGVSGAVAFDGDRTVRWSKLRIDDRSHKVTAVVGGERKAVLSFSGSCSGHRDGFSRGSTAYHHGTHSTVLRLTRAGAASIDYAAAADAFDAGDAFARARG